MEEVKTYGYLKGDKRACDSLVWQLYNRNDKMGGTRLTNRSGGMGDPSLVSRRRNVLVKVKERKDMKKSERRKRRMKEGFCSVLQKPGADSLGEKREMYISKKGRKSEQEIDKYKLLSTMQS